MKSLLSVLSVLVALFVTSHSAHAVVHYAVTRVFLVGGESQEATQELCHQGTPPALAVGVNWRHESDDTVIQLCQRRQRVEEIDSSDLVLQHIAVYDTPACPMSMELLFQVNEDRMVCFRRVTASEVLASGNYISDVWVSTQLNYNTDAVGWTTIPQSVQAPSKGLFRSFWNSMWQTSYHGAFISYQRPVVPIHKVRLLAGVNAGFLRTACFTRIGNQWEDTGAGYLDHLTRGTKSEFCIRRGASDANLPVLLEVATMRGPEECPDRFSQKETLDNDVRLCFRWGEASASESPIVGIYFESLAVGKKPQAVLSGGYQLVSSTSLNIGRRAVFMYAAWDVIDEVPIPAPLDRPPLVAKSVPGANGKTGNLTYKILQLSDLHYTGDSTTKCHDTPLKMKASPCNEALMTKYVNELLDLEKPDFVVFAGDNVQTYKTSLRQASMDAATAGVEARGIPYAMIYGNHDDQRGFTREMMVEMAMAKPHSYTQRGPEEVYGIGNYELNIKAPVDGPWGSAGSDVFRMYFLDSNAYPDHGALSDEDTKYDWIRPSQVAYYRQMSASHTDNQVPAIMFFHIPLPEYAMAVSTHTNGRYREYVQSSDVHSDLFATLVELDEVKATFAGHDHANEYCYKRESIQLCYGGGAGLGMAYGWKEVERRGRVIEWSVDSENKREIRSWKHVFEHWTERRDEQVLYTERE
ncbi:hypothetical protein Poli38472_011784 [Pythium oligandrum]|uniref:Calcineurin-like phosphoesterase domain-containing protein n=1 Tax=Pythium oligandrum TaxID=41045 RepID=A0A8K1C876_PYTOL|nr:hypothetical protein Poli38472_011784 [Pythium oligandrum]|eukprot:TMW58196.1 hypothetical protein Poli38472_011784 [Pythium oligandrum]